MFNKAQVLRGVEQQLNANSPYKNVQLRSYRASMSTNVIERSLNDSIENLLNSSSEHLATNIDWRYMPVYNGIDEALQAVIKSDTGTGECFAVRYYSPVPEYESIWQQAYNRLMSAYITYKRYKEHPRGASTPLTQASAELREAQNAYKEVIKTGVIPCWLVKTDFNSAVIQSSSH